MILQTGYFFQCYSVNCPSRFQNIVIMERQTPNDRRTKGYILMRAIMDYGMGVIIMGVGVFFAFAPRLGYNMDMGDAYRYLLSGIFIVYGGWRIYRGYKKNYFR
jgi:hypothetical protein